MSFYLQSLTTNITCSLMEVRAGYSEGIISTDPAKSLAQMLDCHRAHSAEVLSCALGSIAGT